MQTKKVNFTYDVKQLGITLEVDAEVVPEFVHADEHGDPDGDPAYVDDMQIKVVDDNDANDDLNPRLLRSILVATPRPDLLWWNGQPILASVMQDGVVKVNQRSKFCPTVYIMPATPMGLPQGSFYQVIDQKVCEVHPLYNLLEREALKQAGEKA